MKPQITVTFKIPRYNPGRIIMLETLKEDLEWEKSGTRSHKIIKIKIKALEDLTKKHIRDQQRKKLH